MVLLWTELRKLENNKVFRVFSVYGIITYYCFYKDIGKGKEKGRYRVNGGTVPSIAASISPGAFYEKI